VTRRRAQLTPPADLDDLFGLLKDNLGKAHAFINSAEYQMEQAPSGDDEEELRRQNDVEHLVEAGKLAVRAAIYTTEEIEVRRRRGA
jgi:NAD(P)-dependent dehydrogenase (short-subunit alcohol dehydrogenase family)